MFPHFRMVLLYNVSTNLKSPNFLPCKICAKKQAGIIQRCEELPIVIRYIERMGANGPTILPIE